MVFILPISLLITYYGFDFAYLAFEIGEKSGDPGGLYYRFIIKSIIPLSFILVIISGVIFAKNHYIRALNDWLSHVWHYLIITNGGLPCGLYLCWGGCYFWGLNSGIDLFGFMPYRIMSVMQNTILMAVPLFIFMGIVLQKTKLAEQLLEAMGDLFGNVRGVWQFLPF
ncbi:TRAP dicarboxylate transporter, DctM subunit, unknown substrate 6 [uncultured Gammaproteobacteria bacterium]|nr:TRAP dicarboxylate transporter, DctM subunit, unknown substrate 6 [uncultured Gammaproteobacteria bacterium]